MTGRGCSHLDQPWRSYLRGLLSELGCDFQNELVDVNDEWLALAGLLSKTLAQRAFERGDSFEVADRYSSMQHFWKEADRIETGDSAGTYWDTYENGERRRLEKTLAQGYGSEDALLLNSGMSAIAVALGGVTLRAGDHIVTGQCNYFETQGFLTRFFEPCGIKIIRVDLGASGQLLDAVRTHRPKVVLLETVINAPSLDCPCDLESCLKEFAEPYFIIDNSIQSWLTPWFDVEACAPDHVVVVESATKYITNEVMCGVVYGGGTVLSDIRHFARDTGQQLQGRALHFLQEPMLARLQERLSLHNSNVRLFASALRDNVKSGMKIETLDAHAPTVGWQPFAVGVGCLVFVQSTTDDVEWADVLRLWRQRLREDMDQIAPEIRAGFGWLRTSARSYEGTRLNQSTAPVYLRISCGIEPEETMTAMAEALAWAIDKQSSKETRAHCPTVGSEDG